MSSAAAFTCITCRVSFADADLQRSHYKTDWHRYNLKRKVADLPHVTVEGFNQRVLAQKAQVRRNYEIDGAAIILKLDLQQNSHYSFLVSKDSPCLTLLCCRCKICGNVITSS